jgi:hypothetical protein
MWPENFVLDEASYLKARIVSILCIADDAIIIVTDTETRIGGGN